MKTAEVGQWVTYTYRITNTGEVSLTNVVGVDDWMGVINFTAELPPGGVEAATRPKPIVQQDLPGPLVNTVVVTGTPSGGGDPVVVQASASVNLKEVITNVTGAIASADSVLNIPANVLPPETETLSYVRLEDPTPTTALPADFAGVAFDLKLYDGLGDEITDFTDRPFTITIRYEENDLPAGVDETKLAVYYYADDQWQQIPEEDITRDPDNNTITVRIRHLTEFALSDEGTSNVYLPIILKNE
jgi:hypothetical protein